MKVALEKAEREKNEMRKQLEKAKRDVEDSYLNVNKVTAEYLMCSRCNTPFV